MRIRSIGIIGVVVAATACSSDRAYAPPGTVLTDAQVSADVAGTAGIAAAGSLDEQGDLLGDIGISPSLNTFGQLGPVSSAGVSPSASTSPPPRPSCTYSPRPGSWSCEPFVNAHGQTVIMSYAYFDGSGNPMQSYSATATEKVVYTSQLDGPIGDGATLTGMTHRRQQQILTGLLGKETTRTWNGAGTSVDTSDYHSTSVSRHYVGGEVDTVRNVVYVQPRTPASYPLSGQIIRVANYTATAIGKNTETRSVSRRVVTTFNGTANVTIRTGTTTCTLHLDTRKVDGCTG